MFKFFEKNFIKNKSSTKKENNPNGSQEEDNSFKEADEFLALLTTIPSFSEDQHEIEKYIEPALLELQNDAEALSVLRETSSRFIELQSKIISDIRTETDKIEKERKENTVSDNDKIVFRIAAIAIGVSALAGLLDNYIFNVFTHHHAKKFELITMAGFLLASAVGSFLAEYSGIKAKNKANKKMGDLNTMVKLKPFLAYVSLIEKKRNEGFSYSKELSQKLAKLNLGENPFKGYVEIYNNLIQNESLDLIHGLEIVSKYVDKTENKNDLEYILNKIIKMNPKEKIEYEIHFDALIDDLTRNKSIEGLDNPEYKLLCKYVYPQRNFNTYKNIDEYKDRSKDLKNYKFDKDGYEMRLSGVVGYNIKKGQERNPEILSKYQGRLQKIERLAMTKDNILEFINANFPNTKSKTLEGKIIEYVREHRDNQESVDLLLAYQLSGQYEQFVRESADRTDMYEQMEGKEYIMLAELSERYGDLMKETLKEIGGKVADSADAQLFTKDISKDVTKAKKLASQIFLELSKIPEDKITTETIQKKVIKSIQNTFQQNPNIKAISENFAGAFTKENFSSFEEIFESKITELFQEIKGEVAIDIQKLETLRQENYEEIKSELEKYEEIKEIDEGKKGEVKMSKERKIKGYFSKNKENAHARMIGDICLAADPKMLEKKNYFEFVLFDEERKKCVGTCMLLSMEEPDGKKYLLYCPNPSVDLVSQVSAEKLYKLITSQIITFAKENNFDGVLLNKKHGNATNRSGLFQASLEKSVLRDIEGHEIIFNLKNKHQLSGGYVYQENLNAVWMKE